MMMARSIHLTPGKDHWSFLGYDISTNNEQLKKLTKEHGCSASFMIYRERPACFVNKAEKIPAIRKALWGHEWAIYSGWYEENKEALAGCI